MRVLPLPPGVNEIGDVLRAIKEGKQCLERRVKGFGF